MPACANAGAVMVTPPGLEPGTNSTKNCCATDYTTGYRAKSLAKHVTKSTPRRIENARPRTALPPLPLERCKQHVERRARTNPQCLARRPRVRSSGQSRGYRGTLAIGRSTAPATPSTAGRRPELPCCQLPSSNRPSTPPTANRRHTQPPTTPPRESRP